MSQEKKPFDFFGNMIAKAKNKSKDFVDAHDAKDSEFIDKTATLRPMLKSQFLGLVFLGGFTLIGAKLAYVTLFRPFDEARSSARAETQRITGRADIVDRNGVLLATSLSSFALYANPREIWDARETAIAIRGIFPDLNEQDLIAKLSNKTRPLVWIKRRLTPQQKQQIWELGQPGLEFEQETRRIYPNGELAGHLLGGTNGDGKGIIGLENTYQAQLESKQHAPLKSSIDSRVQYIVEQELAEAVAKYHATSGAALIMDVTNGEIIAAASNPTLNPNKFGAKGIDSQKNNYLSNTFEMGSTFKAFTFAVALNDGKITPDSSFDVSHPINVGGFDISDLHSVGTIADARKILAESSNIGTVQIARLVGSQRLKTFFTDLGLLKKISGGLYGASNPSAPERWASTETATIAFGQGIRVSPLAVIAAYAAIANGGNYIDPTFLVRDPSTPLKATRVISPEASHQILELLRGVVTNGTGKSADVPSYPVAGKTGTADVAGKGGYETNKRVSSFAGVFPANNPKYAILVLVNEPKSIDGGPATAAIVAAPYVAKIIARIGPIMEIAPQRVIAQAQTSAMDVQTKSSAPQANLPNTKIAKPISIGAR